MCGHQYAVVHFNYRGDENHLREIIIKPCDNGSANEMAFLPNGEPKALLTPRGEALWNTQTNAWDDDVTSIIRTALRVSLGDQDVTSMSETHDSQLRVRSPQRHYKLTQPSLTSDGQPMASTSYHMNLPRVAAIPNYVNPHYSNAECDGQATE